MHARERCSLQDKTRSESSDVKDSPAPGLAAMPFIQELPGFMPSLHNTVSPQLIRQRVCHLENIPPLSTQNPFLFLSFFLPDSQMVTTQQFALKLERVFFSL